MHANIPNRFIVDGRKLRCAGLIAGAVIPTLEYLCPHSYAIKRTVQFTDTHRANYQAPVQTFVPRHPEVHKLLEYMEDQLGPVSAYSPTPFSTTKHPDHDAAKTTKDKMLTRKAVSETIVTDNTGLQRIIKHYA